MKNSAFKLIMLVAISASSNVFALDETEESDYAAKGITAGSFKIKPTLEFATHWNDNIYNRQSQTVGAVITHVKPSVNVESNWSRHSLGLNVSSDIQNYINHSQEDRQIIDVGLNGRLDVLQDSFAYANVHYLDSPEQRGAPDSPINALKPTGSQTLEGEVGYDHAIYRVRLHADNNTAHIKFDDGETGLGTAILNNQNRSRLVNTSTMRVGYEITPGYEAFVKGSYNFINYDFKYDQRGYQRSSNGYHVTAGVALELTGKLTGDARVGYQQQFYDDTRFATISGMAGGMTLKWTPTGLTTVTTDVTRTVNQTTQAGASGFFSTAFTTQVEHKLLRNLILSVNGGFTYNEYVGGNAPNKARTEDVYSAGFNAKYLLNRYLFANAGYKYNNRQVQNVSNSNYEANVFYMDIGSQF
jgi:hypothetical protein